MVFHDYLHVVSMDVKVLEDLAVSMVLVALQAAGMAVVDYMEAYTAVCKAVYMVVYCLDTFYMVYYSHNHRIYMKLLLIVKLKILSTFLFFS